MNGWPVELALLAARRWPHGAERLGLRANVQPGSVWIHGASLGEAAVGQQIAASMRPAFVTTDTTSGRTVASTLRPLDHPWTLAPVWAEARPRLLLWIESSWWPALGRLARRSGVPEVAVGLKATPGVLRRFRLLGGPAAALARTDEDAERLAPYTRVLGVTGSFKAAAPLPSPLTWSEPFLVAASAREGDCEALIEAREQAFPGHALLLAPRHPGRIPDTGRPVLRRSDGVSEIPPGHDLYLDTWGELARCLVGAEAAVIGGTWDPALGGHSANETRAAGVRFVHGPCTSSNPGDFAGGVQTARAHLVASLQQALLGPAPAPPTPLDTRPLERLAKVSPEIEPRPWAPRQPRRRVRRRRIQPWVIAVGSFNARGSGKTSTTAFVAHALRRRGLSVCVVTRGVGRYARGVGDSQLHGPDPWWLGDEGAALALQGLRVLAHPDRERVLRNSQGIVVLEDGLHAPIHADVRVEAIDARFPRARGPLLRGEGRTRIATEVRIVHHHGAFAVPPGAHPAIREPGAWSGPFDRCVAFSGIGRPADFFATVPEAEDARGFADHGWHGPARMRDLLDWAAGRTLVTTDRDWVRIAPVFREQVVYRGLRVRVPTLELQRLLP